VNVILTVGDASGQEVFHTFKLAVAAGGSSREESARPGSQPPQAPLQPPGDRGESTAPGRFRDGESTRPGNPFPQAPLQPPVSPGGLAAQKRLQDEESARLRRQLARAPLQAVTPGRFRDHGDYVEDTRTGLLWQKDGDASGKMNYYDAIRYSAGLQLGGLYGWRLPTREELQAIFPAVEPPFTDTKYNGEPYRRGPGEWDSYWTSERDPRLPDYAYVYQWYANGGANNCIASRNFVYVRCVHDPLKK
jgi:hypothetical protein